MRSPRPRLHFAAAALLLLSACGFPQSEWQFHRDLLDTDALADREEYQAALDGYQELALRATNVDLLRYIRYRVALMTERMDDYDDALVQYAAIYNNPYSIHDEFAARSLYNSAHIIWEVVGDEAEALSMLSGLIRMYPNTTSADDAFRDIRRHMIPNDGARALIDYIVSIYDGLSDTEIADNLVYWAARMLEENLEEYEDAIELYDVILRRFHRSGLWDDAAWHIALCHRAMDEMDREYAVLESFVLGREVSWVMADYDSAYYVDAYFRMAEIHESRDEWAGAIDMYRRFQRVFPLSLQVDDVQFRIIELQSYLGDRDGMRESLQWLEDEYPLSRHIEPARELLAQAGSAQ